VQEHQGEKWVLKRKWVQVQEHQQRLRRQQQWEDNRRWVEERHHQRDAEELRELERHHEDLNTQIASANSPPVGK
jgi:hypothetical protein